MGGFLRLFQEFQEPKKGFDSQRPPPDGWPGPNRLVLCGAADPYKCYFKEAQQLRSGQPARLTLGGALDGLGLFKSILESAA